jgi:hypothetical protein
MIKLTLISRWDNLPDTDMWVRPDAIDTIQAWKEGSSLSINGHYAEVRQKPEYILQQMEISTR